MPDLVHGTSKRVTLKCIEFIINAEMKKCDLLCRNGHGSRKSSKRVTVGRRRVLPCGLF